jgi:hypothetical protein
MAFEIADNGPEPSASPPGPFVEPDHPGDLQGWEGRSMDQTHNRPKTPGKPLGNNPLRTGGVPAEETTDL